MKKEFLKSNSKLIEIGSNDGTLLKNFVKTSIDYVGLNLLKSVANQAIKNNVKTVNAFFNKKNIQNFKNFKNKTDVICAANVICHIPRFKRLDRFNGRHFYLQMVFLYLKNLISVQCFQKYPMIKYMMNIFLCFRSLQLKKFLIFLILI